MDLGLSDSYIPQYQFGFKKGNSTTHALLKFHNDVIQHLRKRECTVAISLDIEKAFDKAYHNGILYKMISIGFSPYIVKIFSSYFEDRKFCVEIENTLSLQCNVNCGVPQGSILAPHLYNIFISDFPHLFNNSTGILYADDSLLYAHDESPFTALQRVSSHLEHVNNFYSHWGIKINVSKSHALCLRNASGKCKYTVVPESKKLKLFLNRNEIFFKDNFKYLGVNFNKLLKFNNHVKYNLEKANKIKGAFSKLFNNKFLPVKTKLLLYKVCIRPILIYAFPIWFSISSSFMKRIEIFERHILRKCIGKNYKTRLKRFSNNFIYEKSSVIPISEYALRLMKKFIQKLNYFEGTIMYDLISSEAELSWSNTNYLSAIGILQQQLDNIPGQNFYNRTTPGIHRG